MEKKQKRYTEEFKQSIAKMVDEGQALSHIAREYGLCHTSVANWCIKYGTSSKYNHNRGQAEAEKENKRLRKENYRLNMELDILKKAAAIMSRN